MSDNTAITVLKRYWGYDSFRPLQKEIIESTLSGTDTLALMPTGGGKSITFQVPGLIDDGITLVISPLISLMKDQTEALKRKRIKAVYLHSGMTSAEIRKTWEVIINGNCRFIYFSPERIASERFCMELSHLQICRIVVDEAHCISQWGYDFRPAYLNISKLRKYLPKVPCLALTATATLKVQHDICEKLGFKNHNIFRKSFVRPNINYIVRPTDSKMRETAHILNNTSGSAIVFVRSRKKTSEISAFLEEQGITSTFYHAGMKFEDKEKAQNGWLTGQYRVIVATNAFGMGIDKPDVRVVIHADIPSSPEEYYQEAGRAGRDEKKSFAVLLTTKSDKGVLRRRIMEAFPPRNFIKELYEKLGAFFNFAIGEGYESIREFDIEKFCTAFGLREKDVNASLKILTAAGYIDYIEETESQSRILIIIDREELYSLREFNKVSEKILNCILRLYPGLFTNYVYINESRIELETGLSQQAIYDTLLILDKMKIISYVPRKRIPYIYFPSSLEEKEYILIPKKAYEDRLEVMKHRTETIIDYAFDNKGCRVKRLLAYFNEENTEDCGKCDVCRSKRTQKSANQLKQMTEKVIKFISANPQGVTWRQIENLYPGKSATLFDIVRFQCNEGFITLSDGVYKLSE